MDYPIWCNNFSCIPLLLSVKILHNLVLFHDNHSLHFPQPFHCVLLDSGQLVVMQYWDLALNVVLDSTK